MFVANFDWKKVAMISKTHNLVSQKHKLIKKKKKKKKRSSIILLIDVTHPGLN
jgi:hypothetical protein